MARFKLLPWSPTVSGDMQTRRLHVSGLTPAISQADLTARFSIFGTVTAIDGLGTLDALGQPRKFAFVSLETTSDKYSKCLNVLSGSTWKGTRLRIGEAKPDFQARLEKERAEQDERPTKPRRLRGVQGVQSKDMSLITLDNVHLRRAWKKTALSHLVRPMKMRPLHPIEQPSSTLPSTGTQKKRRRTIILTRARRRKIDPTLYGRVHLTERMLEAEHIIIPVAQRHSQAPPPTVDSVPAVSVNSVRSESTKLPRDEIGTALEEEKKKDLGILAALFNGKDEWDGRESDALESYDEATNKEHGELSPDGTEDSSASTHSDENDATQTSSDHEAHGQSREPTPKTSTLKDIFSVDAATTGPTSILAGLELEFAEDDLDFDAMPVTIEPQSILVQSTVPVTVPVDDTAERRKRGIEALQYSNARPYFFPLGRDERSRGNLKDIFAVADAQNWTRVLSNPLTAEEVRQRWEADKLALTRDWKQRYREASKKERRSGHVEGMD